MKKTKVVLLVLSILICSNFAIADTINVPADQPTIQAGINIAVDGDTVLTQPGTYVENINFNGKNIIVASHFLTTQDTSYISQTIIDGNQNGHVVTFESSEDSTAVLTGFTITNGHAIYPNSKGGGIFCSNSHSIIENNIIKENIADNAGGGIYCNNSSPIIRNNKILDNISWDLGGGGICCDNESNPLICSSIIMGNYNDERGGGICCWYSSPTIENVTITGNNANYDGGGGIYCNNNSSPSLQNVTIENNSASGTYGYGGGIYCRNNSSPSLDNVTITDNSASNYGGGIYCYSSSSPSIVNSIISDNMGNYGIYVYSGNPTISYCDFWNNDGGNYYNVSTGIGCIEADPLFVDPENGDYHLHWGSPCIDSGDPNSPFDPDGTIADMGAYYYDQSEYDITFNSLADMNTARLGFGYTTDGNYLYAVCGGTYEPPFYQVNNIEKYDPTTNNWEVFVDGLIPRRYSKAEYLQSTNKIYIFGGQTYYETNPSTYTDTVEVVDVANGNISYLTSNPNPYTSSGSAVWNDKIYIFGGSEHGVYLNAFYEFDPINNIWNQLPDMPEAKQTEGEVVDGILYVFGGYNGSVQSNRIDAYDIQNNEWLFIGYMPEGISAHHTTVKGQYIWILGDYDILNYVAIFNTETYEFTQLNTNMIGRRHCGTEVIGNNLYVYGGNIASGGPALSSLQYADISYLSINDEPYEISSSITLFQNYPNPFNPETTISFYIKQNSKIELEIFNIKGQKVKTLINDYRQSGYHAIPWNGDDNYGNRVSSGLYFYKLSVDGKTEVVKKCLLVISNLNENK